MTTATTDTWRAAGDAWGHRAADWSCLFEHYSHELLTAMFPKVRVGPGIHLLDIACGAGMAARHARAAGATVSGIDASEALIEVARTRNPGADLRVGSMFELPWNDQTFDAAISINGIWGGCEQALTEALRVLRPGGLLGISFWGTGPPLDLRPCFKVFARHAPTDHYTSMKRLNDIASPDVAEEMLVNAGFEVLEQGRCVSTIEWPDPDTAWRALASTGPAVPALRHGDPAEIKQEVLTAIAPCRDENGIYRFRNDHRYALAKAPTQPTT
ncbi:methyltransferase domain-containing protein [Spirillospora sp. NPDC047279]|uniref:class I SAM-dependent methyltransferase n=1 Tax=Spirillospora sp. NPDC047279 TaxID=3155478 RepID=UPI0033FBDD34